MSQETAAIDGVASTENTDLEGLLDRINRLANGEEPPPEPSPSAVEEPVVAVEPPPQPEQPETSPSPPEHKPQVVSTDASVVTALHARSKVNRDADAEDAAWTPAEPNSLEEAGVSDGQLEHLILKLLGAVGDESGRNIAAHHALPFRLVEPVLANTKQAQLVAFRGSAPMNDYVYQLTDKGRETAKKLTEYCSYFGAAPVTLDAYIRSVSEQTLTKKHPTEDDLHRAFSDLLINKRMLRRLGPAMNSGRGLFLFGAPGNGKTSIAERVTKAFGDTIWIPRCISIDGEVMRVYDPGLHEEVPPDDSHGPLHEEAVDKRWVRIRRPTIVAGGELTMDALEVNPSSGANVSEAPLQLKSNCGTLVIDDFGRQRMTTDELLNRWIVPLEKRYDFLRMVNGKKIQVPFDQLIIFSTNLEPKDLVDDAFLRRIPYKIEVIDPSEEEFRELFKIMAKVVGMDHVEEAVEYLIEHHYKVGNRPFRCCQPRDLLLQIRNYCHYLDVPPQMCKEYFDYAVENYFAVM